MRFQTRNAYYLRISATTVIPLYLYLDERHVEWMSERVLQHVLADLRPLILPKLNAEADAHLGPGGPASAKRGTLDVHRGDTYQFGYFLRATEPHAVLIKTRTFVAAPKPTPRTTVSSGGSKAQQVEAAKTGKGGRKRKPAPRPKAKGKARAIEDDEISISSDDEGDTSAPTESIATRRSKRARKVAAGAYTEDADEDISEIDPPPGRDQVASHNALDGEHSGVDNVVTLKHEETEPSLADLPAVPVEGDTTSEIVVDQSPMEVELVDEEEEEKPKPILKFSYHGFTIHGRCLCVIVEPYPPLRSTTRAPSLAPTGLIAPRAPSIAPADFVPTGGAGQRERTPLFLPDFDREPTPAPAASRNLPPVPLFNEAAEGSDEEDDGGMVLFSQILRSMGDHPPGIAEDDDEIEGAVFFGDADETREL
ncbi:hypothetical protein C8Q70DRAFT_912074 [Cubamyces menziesii]|nr:hypothetical protein C8Q70DRAFT_912074 [Cubamyces menziesii]